MLRTRWTLSSARCNSLDSTLRTALASFYVSNTDWYSMEGDFECNGDVSPTIALTPRQAHWNLQTHTDR